MSADKRIGILFVNVTRNARTCIAGARVRKFRIPMFTDDELQRLTMPRTVFVGSKYIMLPSNETAEQVTQFMPHAEVMILPDKGYSLSGLSSEMLAFIEK